MGQEHLAQFFLPNMNPGDIRFRVIEPYRFGNIEEVQLEQFLYWHDVPDLLHRITGQHLETVARRLLHLARLAVGVAGMRPDWEGGNLRRVVKPGAVSEEKMGEYLLFFDVAPGKLRTEHLKAAVAQMSYLEAKVARAVKA